MNRFLFFDTETTDLPKFKLPDGHESQPRLMQLAALLTDAEGTIMETYSTYVQIGSAPINKYALAAHGISRDKANSEGVEPYEAYNEFYNLSIDVDAYICHNFNFDKKMLDLTAALLIPSNPEISDFHETISDIPFYCTMASTTSYLKLPFPSGRKGYKFPKLSELHTHLFGSPHENLHDALGDVIATKNCFFELRSRGVL